MIAAIAKTMGTMPPMWNRICQPYCGTNAALAKPGSAPPIGTRPTAMMASVARRLRGAEFGVDGDDIRNDAADAEAGDEAQPEQFGEIGRIGGDEGEDAEQQIRADQRRLAAVAVADPAENLRAEQDADIAGAEHRAERLGAMCHSLIRLGAAKAIAPMS